MLAHFLKKSYLLIFSTIFRIIPLNNEKVFFSSFNGGNYSGNPRALSETKEFENKQIVWSYKNPKRILSDHPDWIVVRPFRPRTLFHMMTSGTWIVNAHINPNIVKRRGQRIIQTWHGIPLKVIGCDIPDKYLDNKMKNQKKLWIKDAQRWDEFLSPSPEYNQFFQSAFRIPPEKIVNRIYPRNHILLEKQSKEYLDSLKGSLNLPKDKKIVLYAPTYREGKFKISLPFDCNILKEEIGDKAVLCLKMHPHIISVKIPAESSTFCLDLSWYENINELFLITDILVTDYSSVLFDFELTGKQIVYYPYDLEEYQKHERPFYRPYEQVTKNNPVCSNQSELFNVLNSCLS
jgi:CDP-glycerol glycerophosphotransferase